MSSIIELEEPTSCIKGQRIEVDFPINLSDSIITENGEELLSVSIWMGGFTLYHSILCNVPGKIGNVEKIFGYFSSL